MDNHFTLSMETALLFVVVLLLAFSCGFFRILKQYFSRRTHRRPAPIPQSVLIAQIRTRAARTQVSIPDEPVMPGIFPGEEQLSPPPYSVVSNILPPSYDEAVKHTERNQGELETPKNDGKF